MAAVEGLKIKQPGSGGAEIDLNGSQWGLEVFDLGAGAERDEMVSSVDSDGARPARVPMRDNREVTARVRLQNATNMDDALAKIGALEQAIASARKVAASGPADPIDTVRLIYTPADGTKTYFLPIWAAEISEAPKVISGDDAGWFIKLPILTLRFSCDPFGYGTYASLYSATIGAGLIAVSATIPGGDGDVSPWLKVRLADAASKTRGRVIMGVRRGEASVSSAILATALTVAGYAGTIGSGYLIGTSTEWAALGAVPTQTRKGPFRVYLTTAFSLSSNGKVRFSWAESGSSRATLSEVPLVGSGVQDLYLGTINPGSSWDAWIEGKGDVRGWSVLLVPADDFIEVVSAAAGRQLVGPSIYADNLTTPDSSNLAGRYGVWAEDGHSPTTGWPVTAANSAMRTLVSMPGPTFAKAGTTNTLNVEARGETMVDTPGSFGIYDWTRPVHGLFIRYVDSSNFLVAGWALNGGQFARPGVWKCVAGVYSTLWLGSSVYAFSPYAFSTGFYHLWRLQAVSDGRWFVSLELRNSANSEFVYWSESASGADGHLVQGEALGNASAAKTGIYDYFAQATPALNRRMRNFAASGLVGVTPPPIPSGAGITLKGPLLETDAGGEYPYVGGSGLELAPGVSNNLTLLTRRSPQLHANSGTANMDSTTVTIGGYPRFLTVPH